MDNFELNAKNLSKTFDNKEWIYKNINLNIKNKSAIAITGRNGSGKSTLLKTLATIINPTNGTISFEINGIKIEQSKIVNYIGYVSPYLNLYEEFTAQEHIELYFKLKGINYEVKKSKLLLQEFLLDNTGTKYISQFSSGMKQRLKYILALITEPLILFLDEPFTNLDNQGIMIVENFISKHLDEHKAVIIASNDKRETNYCNNFIELNRN